MKLKDSHIVVTDRFDKAEFNRFINENPNANIFQTLEMAKVYKRTKGDDSLVLAAINEETGQILATLMAKIWQPKRGFLGKFSRYSSIRYGPLLVQNENGYKALSKLMDEYNNIVNNKVIYTRIYPNTSNSAKSLFKEKGYNYEYWGNFLIKINKTLPELWGNLRKNRKRCIKKAEKHGLGVVELSDKSELQVFYELVKERYDLKKIPLEDISKFEAVYDILVPKNKAKFLFAKYKDEYIASALILLYRKRIYLWYMGFKKSYSRYCPNDFLIWEIIKWGHENNYKLFDWGGGGTINQKSDSWVEFKRRFGGEEVNFGRYTKIHNILKFKLAEFGFKLYKKGLIK